MNRRLLLAEDDPDVSRLLTRALQREGYDVAVGKSTDAILVGLTTGPDIVVIDGGLPGPGGGLEVCRHLRDAGNTVPVLLLMNSATGIDLAVARDSGADDCLVKPFRTAELLARIPTLMPRAHRGSRPARSSTWTRDPDTPDLRRCTPAVDIS